MSPSLSLSGSCRLRLSEHSAGPGDYSDSSIAKTASCVTRARLYELIGIWATERAGANDFSCGRCRCRRRSVSALEPDDGQLRRR